MTITFFAWCFDKVGELEEAAHDVFSAAATNYVLVASYDDNVQGLGMLNIV